MYDDMIPGSLLSKPLAAAPILRHYGLYLGAAPGRFPWDPHWVIDIRKVIGTDQATVRLVTLDHFMRDGDVSVEPPLRPVNAMGLWASALNFRRRGVIRYSLVNGNGFNCESFARLVRGDRPESHQVQLAVGLGLMAVGLWTAAAFLGAAAAHAEQA